MDTRKLHYYCAIVEQGSISRAARKLHISQPPLSLKLKELEDELGVVLIVRDSGQWNVTEAGCLLYEKARIILDTLKNLSHEVTELGERCSGQIAIGVSTTCESLALRALPSLYKNFPLIRYRIMIMDSSLLESSIQDGKLDLAIVTRPFQENMYEVTSLPRSPYCVIFGQGLTPPQKKSVLLEELTDTPLILSRRWFGQCAYDLMMNFWNEHDIKPHIVLDCHNIHTLLNLIDHGMQVASIVPYTEVSKSLRRRYAIRILDSPEIALLPTIIMKKGKFIGRALRMVRDAIVESSLPGDKA